MRDPVAKLSKGGKVVVDQCAGTFLLANMMLSKHPRFVGSEIDAVCLNALLLFVVETIVQHLLNEALDTKGNVGVVAAARTYLSGMDGSQARRKQVI